MNKVKITIMFVLVCVCVIAGALLLYLGITGTASLNNKTNGYVVTSGHFVDYELFSPSNMAKNENATYTLTYAYTVDGHTYRITTDYATSIIPQPGSAREIRYDPAAPENAVITGMNSSSGLIFGGVLFLIVPVLIVLGFLFKFGYLNPKGLHLLGVGIGAAFIFIGYGALYAMSGTFSLIKAVHSAGMLSAVPLLFMAVGVIQTVKSLFNKQNKSSSK